MSRRLKYSVAVGNDIHVAGTSPSAEVAKLITNPDAWEDDDASSSSDPGASFEIPPKGGAGSGKEAWADYAAERGVEVDEDATRDEIVAALDAAGVPTE